jgi:hypothetical protein
MQHPHIVEARYLAAIALLALGGVLVAGCASTKIQAQWADPQFAERSLRGEQVLIVCTAEEAAIKRICQEELRAQVSASGATPVTAPEADNLTPGQGPASEPTLAVARSMGAKAVLAATVAPDAMIVNAGPTIGIGVGGFGGSGGWGSGTAVGGGVGVSMPVGGYGVNRAYGANLVLTDVATGRLMWTSKVTTRASQDLNAQIGALAKVGVTAAQSAGLF